MCVTRHQYCDSPCNVPASGLKWDSIFASCVPRLCVSILPHLCRMFWVHSGRSHFWLHLLLLECFAASRVPSLTTLVALGRTRLLATPGFTELHKAPYFQKCPSSKKTSICEHFTSVPKHKISKMPQLQNQGWTQNTLFTKRWIT